MSEARYTRITQSTTESLEVFWVEDASISDRKISFGYKLDVDNDYFHYIRLVLEVLGRSLLRKQSQKWGKTRFQFDTLVCFMCKVFINCDPFLPFQSIDEKLELVRKESSIKIEKRKRIIENAPKRLRQESVYIFLFYMVRRKLILAQYQTQKLENFRDEICTLRLRSTITKRTSAQTVMCRFSPQSNINVVTNITDVQLLCICATYIQTKLKMCANVVLLCQHILSVLMAKHFLTLSIIFISRNSALSTYSISSLRKKIWLPPDQLQYNRTYTIFPAFAPMMSIVDRLAKKEKVHPKESMRYEMMRFCTLRSYPAEGKPSVLKFAKAGFYYASNKDEVICYCCAKRISNWKPDDDPYQAHKRITPNCSFIVNNGEVNVPVSSDTGSNSNDVLQKIITDLDKNNNVWRFDTENSGSDSKNDIATDDDEENEDLNNGNPLVTENYKKETSFVPKRNYNVIDTVSRGKDSGYASLPIEPTNTSGSLDEDCFSPEPQGGFASMAPISENSRINPSIQTGITLPLKDFESQIANINTKAYQPAQEDRPRQRTSNRQSRIRTRRQRQQSSTQSESSGNTARTLRSNETVVSNVQTTVSTRTARNRIGLNTQIPKHPKYSTISSRIASFNQCPEIHVMPRTLAEAGFYYAGIGDCTRCFWCGIGLRHWTREDDPWTEHARFSLDCNHVLINKGQEFINLVKLALDLTEEKDECPQAQASEAPTENHETGRPKDDVEDLMTSDAAQSVRDMGYNDDIIRIAIRAIITSKGKEKLNGMNIMEEIFRIEDEPVNNKNDSTGASSTVQTITSRSTETCTPVQKNENTTDGNKSGQETATSIQTEESQCASAELEKKTVEHRHKRRLLNENKALKESTMCSSCSKKEVCIVFLPCGHLISCEQCGSSVRTCMTCGQRVRGTVRTYRA
ncbi:DIAP2-like protein [Mya arenaria]|uniref:DIAP2-like protein n=1 Tax=Mya arenaria TaxID=6604 RepID=A0ABY7F139_MYAAR|nr:DIAP2-like protein [Mya arenaria]